MTTSDKQIENDIRDVREFLDANGRAIRDILHMMFRDCRTNDQQAALVNNIMSAMIEQSAHVLVLMSAGSIEILDATLDLTVEALRKQAHADYVELLARMPIEVRERYERSLSDEKRRELEKFRARATKINNANIGAGMKAAGTA